MPSQGAATNQGHLVSPTGDTTDPRIGHPEAGKRSLARVRRFVLATSRTAVITMVAAATALIPSGTAAAAGATLQVANPVCDASTSPRTISVAPPLATAMDDTAATDTNLVRYWARLYNASTGAVVTNWSYGGQTTSTDTAAGAFPVAGKAFGTPYYIRYRPSISAPLKVQYFVAWYRTNGALRATTTFVPPRFKLVTLVYIFGSGFVPVVSGTTPTC
jgi:hypothetical protein